MTFVILLNLERLFYKYYLLVIGAVLVISYIFVNDFKSFNIDDFAISIGSSRVFSTNIEYIIFLYFSLINFAAIIFIVNNARLMSYDQTLIRLKKRKFNFSQTLTMLTFIIVYLSIKYLISCISYTLLSIDLQISKILYLFITEFVFLLFISNLFFLIYTISDNYSLIFVILFYLVSFNLNDRVSRFSSIQYYQSWCGICLLLFFTFLTILTDYLFSDNLITSLIEKEKFHEHN